MAVALMMPATLTGVVEWLVVPSPRLPSLLYP